MSHMETFNSDQYDDGRTKQSFKDQTNINKILARAANGQTISHISKYGAVYGDFSDIDDLLAARDKLERGKQIFHELPGEIRREFANDPSKFFHYVNDPRNAEDLTRVLPALAAPGNQMPAPLRNAGNQGEPANPASPPTAQPETPPAAS